MNPSIDIDGQLSITILQMYNPAAWFVVTHRDSESVSLFDTWVDSGHLRLHRPL